MNNSKTIASIEFMRGVLEARIPEIRLTRSKDGNQGQALFVFTEPEILNSEDSASIKVMILKDQEGELTTRDLNIKLGNDDRKNIIEAVYKWNSITNFQRFMRFAEKYSEVYELDHSGN